MPLKDPGKSNALRVLFVNRMACLERGGGETFDLEISRHLARAGAQVTCLCGAPLLRPPPLPVAGARTLRTPWLRRFPWDKVKGGWRVRQLEFELFEWRAARWIERLAAEFDVIQVCELPNLVHWLKQRGVKTPVVMRLTAPNYYDPRGGVRQADALIASGTTIEKLRAHNPDDARPKARSSTEVAPPEADSNRSTGSLEGRPPCRPVLKKGSSTGGYCETNPGNTEVAPPEVGTGLLGGVLEEAPSRPALPPLTDIPNAVDAEMFRPQSSDFRARHGIGRDEFVALYVARFQAFKNHAMLLDAFALFTREHPAARLVLAGSGPLQERCEQQAAVLGIAGQVLFLGEVPYADLPAVYAAADVKVISSDYESFCFAAIEAMSAGVPVLTTDCAWVPRLVADGAGMVVPVGDAEAFAAGLKKLADNPALRQRMGAAGRQQVLERHTWPASAEKLLELYWRLASRAAS